MLSYGLENGLLTQSRLILLDSPLIIFTAFTVLAWTCFTNQHEQGSQKAFQPSWWFWLIATGVGLGATVSVKWVGLFTIAWVGSLTIVQLWVLLGDTRTVTPVSLGCEYGTQVNQHAIAANMAKTLFGSGCLSDFGPDCFLHGSLCDTFRLPCESW